MARTRSVTLDDHFENFIVEQVDSGRFGSASDVVEEGLRMLEDREIRLEALRAALLEGEKSGTPNPIDLDEFLAARHAEWQE